MYRKWYILDLYEGVTKSCFTIFPPAAINLKNIFRRSFAKKKIQVSENERMEGCYHVSLMSLHVLKYSIFSSLGSLK